MNQSQINQSILISPHNLPCVREDSAALLPVLGNMMKQN
jgi:hypothetical protein